MESDSPRIDEGKAMKSIEIERIRLSGAIIRKRIGHMVQDGCKGTEVHRLPQVKAFPQNEPIQIVCLECGKWIDLDGEPEQ